MRPPRLTQTGFGAAGSVVVAASVLLVFLAMSAAAPSSGAAKPTRLTNGPVVFRIAGGTKDPDSFEAGLRYVIVFKLNRDPKTRLSGDDYRRGIDNPRGNYSILGRRINLTDECCYPAKFRNVDRCFMTYVGTDHGDPRAIPLLNRVRIGQRVDVQIQPLTPSVDGRPKLGARHNRRVTLRAADAKLRSPSAREALNRIGCLRP